MKKEIKFDIFISSSDNYYDIWPLFFQLFQLHWPEYNGKIFLNTQRKMISWPGLNITCTNVGDGMPFGKTFNLGLDQVESSNILLIMIDYLFMERVDTSKLSDAFSFFINNDLDSLCLICQDYDTCIPYENNIFKKIIPPSKDLFSFQIAFWKKSVLRTLVLNHETPWSAEWFGSKRASNKSIKLACLSKDIQPAIVYDAAGCLHKGKWLHNAIDYLKGLAIDFPFDKRGVYDYDDEISFRNKFKLKMMLWRSGFRGSFWN